MLALALGLFTLPGCGDRGGGTAAGPPDTSPRYSIVLEPAEPDWDASLPADVCYVAARNYEVEISTRSEQRHSLCDRLASTYLPHEPRLRWPPPYLRDPDSAPSVVCVLARGTERTEIDYGPADSGRLDAEAICDALRAQGWKRRPAWEGLEGP
jgi:hypothetical protein